MSLFESYVAEMQETLGALPLAALEACVDALHRARVEDRQVFVVGNGGSASTASHMACDLGKNTVMPGLPRFRVMALTDNMATFSALANDVGYDNVFAEQLANFVRREDILVAISTSGNSANVIRAVELANRVGATTIGFSGYDGGKLAAMADIPIVVPNHCVEQIEDIHLILEHMLTVALRKAIEADVGKVEVEAKAQTEVVNGVM
jgi:D-sedoheptulose 7-phosphate isomerase